MGGLGGGGGGGGGSEGESGSRSEQALWLAKPRQRRGEGKAARGRAGQGRARRSAESVAAGYSRDGWDGSGMANGMKHRSNADAGDGGVGGGARKET